MMSPIRTFLTAAAVVGLLDSSAQARKDIAIPHQDIVSKSMTVHGCMADDHALALSATLTVSFDHAITPEIRESYDVITDNFERAVKRAVGQVAAPYTSKKAAIELKMGMAEGAVATKIVAAVQDVYTRHKGFLRAHRPYGIRINHDLTITGFGYSPEPGPACPAKGQPSRSPQPVVRV